MTIEEKRNGMDSCVCGKFHWGSFCWFVFGLVEQTNSHFINTVVSTNDIDHKLAAPVPVR